MKPGGRALRQRPDGVRESPLQTGKYVLESEPDKRELNARQVKFREMRSMTGSLRWITGTRRDESFATSQLQRKQSTPLVSV